MSLHVILDLISSVPTPSPLPTPDSGGAVNGDGGGNGSGFAPYATLTAAVIAAAALLIVNLIQRSAAEKNLQHLKNVAAANDIRANADGLAKRYQEAASQIGHDKPAVRLAGVYALARLADDWPEQRQTCVDVLCAFLRMQPTKVSYTTEEGYPFDGWDDGEMQVRQTVIGIVTSRINGTDAIWAACDFNLAGSYLVDFKLRDAWPAGKFIINGATIDGTCEFTRVVFGGGLDARELRIEGTLSLIDSRPGPKRSLALTETFIASEGTLNFVLSNPPKVEDGWAVWPNRIRCAGLFAVKVKKTPYEQATFKIPELQLLPSGTFRAVPIPAPEPESTKKSKIEARAWATSASSTIDMSLGLRQQEVFSAFDWTGVHKKHFERAYIEESDTGVIDELCDGDDY
ncbi:MAG: hypothetical protein ABF306_16470 [Nocardioides marinisabuli]|uniref:hypothetical protein n=1 Tax=Nocardioides marinisabuli TaxID=419476 RepID=UPI00321A16F9